MKIANHKKLWLGALCAFLIDQLTKSLALSFLNFEEEIVLNKWFSFIRIYNESTLMLNINLPFGMSTEQFRLAWVAGAVLLAISIFWVTNKPAMKEETLVGDFGKTGVFLIMGGIWGNAFDRVFRENGVIDFIAIRAFEDTCPVFNFADVIIYMGEICILMGWLCIFYQLIKNAHTKWASKNLV